MLWRGAGGGGLLAGTQRRPAAEDGVPPSLQISPHTHILLARSPAPYSPFRRRAHSPTADGAPASLPPASSSLTHTRRMDGFCNQNADQLGSLARLSFPVVYVGVVECASQSAPTARKSPAWPASPYTYSSTHRFPDERAHLSRLRLFQRHLQSLGWVWVWVWDWVHTPPHTLLSFSPPSFHTISLSLAFTSV